MYHATLYDIDFVRALWYVLLYSAVLAVLYRISLRISGTRVSDLAVTFGRNLTTMYMVQWYIVGFIIALGYAHAFTPIGLPAAIVLTVAVIVVTHLVSVWYLKNVKPRVPGLRDL